jgi:ubiquinol oxidase
MPFDLRETGATDLSLRHKPRSLSDRVAFALTKVLRFLADTLFRKRYGHRAVILETVAAVPGMVGGMLNHLTSLRRMQDDRGWIHTLLAEAENERMHLMTFIAVAQPNAFERGLIIMAQGIFFNAFFLLYLFAPRTAHRMVGYFEEEAVISYTQYLAAIDAGDLPNPPAPQLAIDYWKLPPDALLRDVVVAVRNDEAGHRDVNHAYAEALRRAA